MPRPFNQTDLTDFVRLPKPQLIIISDDEDAERPSTKRKRSQGRRSRDSLATIMTTNLRDQIGHAFVYMIIPPDGGYGWVIILISFLNQLIVDGIILGSGNLLFFIGRDLNEPQHRTVMVMGVLIGFYFLSGTVSGAYVNKYGFRPVAVAGILIAITVIGISTYSPNLEMLIFFYGVCGGPSLSLVWVSSQLIIGYYFEKRRPIAVGLSCSGAGVGIALISLMNSLLLPRIDWRNTLRVHMLLLTVSLFLVIGYIDVKPSRVGKVAEPVWSDSESTTSDETADIRTFSIVSVSQSHDATLEITSELSNVLETHEVSQFQRDTTWWGRCCPLCFKYCRKSKEVPAGEHVMVIKPDILERHDAFYIGPLEEVDKSTESIVRRSSTKRISLTVALEGTTEKTRAINNRMQRIHTDKVTMTRRTYRQLKETTKYPFLQYISPQNWLHPKIKKALSLLFDCRLMAVLEFRIIWFAAFLFTMGYNVPLIYATPRAEIDHHYAIFITPVIGLSNFIFRLSSGFVAFWYRQYTTVICGCGLMLGGFFVFLSAFVGINLVWFQYLFGFVYGIAPALFSTLRAIIYVRTLGLDKLTNAFGLTAVAMGFGVFIGTAFSTILIRVCGSYQPAFAVAGLCIMTTGALKLSLLVLKKVK